MYIVIREEINENLKTLEKLLKVCPDDISFHKDNTTIKDRIKKDIDYYKWKLSKKRVKDWCKTSNIELAYFLTKAEYEKWRGLEDIKDNYEIELRKLEIKQQETIDLLKARIDEIKEEKLKAIYDVEYLFKDDDPIFEKINEIDNKPDLNSFTDDPPF